MKTVLSHFEVEEFEQFDEYLNDTFEKIYPLAKRIISERVSKHKHLHKMMRQAVSDRSPSEHPFIFRFSYQHSGKQFRKIRRIAAAIHLLQTSTFVIDDVFDDSIKRGDEKTVYSSHGTNYAIITGELLQTISLNAIMSEIVDKSFPNGDIVVGLFVQMMNDVYMGQYIDIFQTAKWDTTLQSYYKMISLTTASFVSNVSKAGALLGNLPKQHIDSLSKYGYFYGLALQVCDDIIDVIDSSSDTGKTFASDIKCRRLRLPLILALKLSSKEERDFLTHFMSLQNELSHSDIRRVIGIMERCGSIEQCKAIAGQWIYKALQAISKLETRLPKNMLRLLALNLLRDIGVVR